MKRAIALRHVHFEDLGTLEPVLREIGYNVRYVEAATDDLRAPDLDQPDILFVLGGPVSAYDEALYPFLTDELALIERRLSSGLPIVGICLGAQLMARALGARVYASGVKEIAWSTLTLTEAAQQGPLRHLADTPVLHWHGDTFDLPEGALHLASTPLCRNQAFSVGANALGLQFHIELAGADIEHWLVGHAVEIASAGASVTALRADTKAFATACAAKARQCLADWLDGIGEREQKAAWTG